MNKTTPSLLDRLRMVARRNRFARDERGVTMIEFGLLAVPFFAILGAILETSVVFLAGQVLDSSVNNASRLIRTGQAGNFTIERFQKTICDNLYGMFRDCDQLRINVNNVTDFTSTIITSPIVTPCAAECSWAIPAQYDPGQGGSIIMVRVYYKWPVILNWPDALLPGGFTLADQPDGSRLLGAVRIFRNEPFTGSGSGSGSGSGTGTGGSGSGT
ncbi:hypothetical protein VW29_18880 [Devosia limi DSM 17137]|uniref:Flp pilus assembly protein TadG n=1 Tax=Devosia limi DSM 17137 TaxID=1121477 RepID=A0A0F5L4B4_9HYPH|nr:TadE/TadG family type IV pilus assembly protein [Devosia limi]KKB77029.1 hypothetical protein VW29_18880 [Devosia limi DSM 17137]SHF42827.1 Flp pilus assembly protein TadG [Devosia limi DSM 17137]